MSSTHNNNYKGVTPSSCNHFLEICIRQALFNPRKQEWGRCSSPPPLSHGRNDVVPATKYQAEQYFLPVSSAPHFHTHSAFSAFLRSSLSRDMPLPPARASPAAPAEGAPDSMPPASTRIHLVRRTCHLDNDHAQRLGADLFLLTTDHDRRETRCGHPNSFYVKRT